ncbi:related to CSN12-COP9 signalosome (CSN) subunit [Ustilago bromivora]|uniref:Related to CSN12 - COP9 signalosome (CSN) subunit n=1 Tax=Ustilago bromivora TaxID=307758 RepID=A0A1K0G6P4_9BASI|nr:related to CSN12-COP9 signalosome (CSN) subunit [Ustilago bromivora]SYW74937.1 related to CSN12 - COP9 signalosome (CSN) subunit [Ustilago bromivora]
MKPALFADAVITASKTTDGHSLAQLFAIGGPIAASLLLELGDPQPNRIISSLRKCPGYLSSPWENMCLHHLSSLYSFSLASSLSTSSLSTSGPYAVDAEGKNRAERLGEAFDSYNAAVTAFVRHFATLTPGRWAIPLLRILCLNLRWLAVQADEAALEASNGGRSGKGGNSSHPVAAAIVAPIVRTSSVANKRLEECARQLNKAFTACIADRNVDVQDSRKWGTYEIVGMVFKTYFRLKSVSLCRNILRAISAAVLPDLELFPKSQQVTFRYYVGVLAFLNEEYDKAEGQLSAALRMCNNKAVGNQVMILTYLIPIKLVKGSLPYPALLDTKRQPYIARKLAAYTPFISALRQGDVKSFDLALKDPIIERWLVNKGTFIAMERARDVTLRTLLKHIWLSLPQGEAPSRPTRLSLETLHKATSSNLVGLGYELKQLEWVLATLIYKGYVKGYIAHERAILVLSANNPFPPLGSVPTT